MNRDLVAYSMLFFVSLPMWPLLLRGPEFCRRNPDRLPSMQMLVGAYTWGLFFFAIWLGRWASS